MKRVLVLLGCLLSVQALPSNPLSKDMSSKLEKTVSSCPDGWADIGTRCILVHGRNQFPLMPWGWDEAQVFCRDFYKGELAEFADRGEFWQISYLLSEIYVADGNVFDAWIGVTDNGHGEGDWRWASSDEPAFSDDVEYWMDGQPNYANHGEHCVAFHQGDRKLFDVACGTGRVYPICQIMKENL